MDASILLIEDDPDICELVAIYLRREGFRVDMAASAEQGLNLFHRSTYDLLISDIMLPGMDGMHLVPLVRSRSDIPIIFMTSKKTPQDIVAGLHVGGDDYITKPFEPEVLVARVKAGLRRYRAASREAVTSRASVWKDQWLAIDKEKLEVFVNNKPIDLPAKELQLLLHLLEHPKQVFNVGQLYETIWSLNGTSDDRTVMVHIHNLRKKIEKDPANPRYIVTVRGFGYKFAGGK
ncbi:response regulator transcription factor [Paenibacillus mesophilus]|uniref:response regulator transcription factor n=1 Tax=Paenibacillus mesophilus TaxID=2582849 RepID=UPI00110D5E20|nr:response regulator transcription factor [Paenibacillus mesophilus]TMV50898.1 response regulator transcription factor [Paenibacillus mesophilus]